MYTEMKIPSYVRKSDGLLGIGKKHGLLLKRKMLLRTGTIGECSLKCTPNPQPSVRSFNKIAYFNIINSLDYSGHTWPIVCGQVSVFKTLLICPTKHDKRGLCLYGKTRQYYPKIIRFIKQLAQLHASRCLPLLFQ